MVRGVGLIGIRDFEADDGERVCITKGLVIRDFGKGAS